MGIYDRDYAQDNQYYRGGGGGGMRLGVPKMTPMVKKLLIINVAVYFLNILIPDTSTITFGGHSENIDFITRWFSLIPDMRALMVWRFVSYQFLHGGLLHILFNMIALFFLGPTLERHWGSNKFLKFYLGCGIAGGLTYVVLAQLGIVSIGYMIGASGAVLGLLAACAILFPHFVVFFMFFPVPIRVAAVILTFIFLANVLSNGYNAGGDAAHLGGMAAGAAYVLSGPWRRKMNSSKEFKKQFTKKSTKGNLHQDVDRILDKVHSKGIQSLSRKEKKILRQATKTEQLRRKYDF